MMPNQEKAKKRIMRKLGFTMNEIVMTVAIVSAVTAVAVPNFMRIKMNVNMELVKQHLKAIGESMTEIMGKQGMFPEESQWGSGTSEEEMSITANLNAIDIKQYTTSGYSIDRNRASYTFTTCPKEGAWSVAGDRCFILTSLGITEDVSGALAGAGAVTPPDFVPVWSFLFDQAMDNGMFGSNQKRNLKILQNQLEQFAYYTSMRFNLKPAAFTENPEYYTSGCSTCATGIPLGMTLPGSDKNLAILKEMLPKITSGLESKGITMTFFEREGKTETLNLGGTTSTFKNRNEIVVGYELKKPVLSWADYEKRRSTIRW